MNITKNLPLESTCDENYLLSDSFLHQSILTDVYLYPTYISVVQKNNRFNIPINFNLSFSIIQGPEGPEGI